MINPPIATETIFEVKWCTGLLPARYESASFKTRKPANAFFREQRKKFFYITLTQITTTVRKQYLHCISGGRKIL